ncbi:ShlB/FhaC/HecB family hemolysin secretion/activation protein [Nostoc spongiaeforme FACHB-130]|uniref:ShlB/FhaC/HecB family hemolysin secretion/activation protein n=1 Tax=Nostoc spongiaeforme FACHB-130 TaxID=1357510 RepID=A0ABR8FWL8_9NOSO|nr:ShlB/FhaC/HecB family hemolysin secretion/activation protein [Nostoc spongiaeforme]MBD2594643.1 ShlB/FhaC/HecB family hemolysin secretion/activation protein [Nostoc spongiaeforme FACHB-130]
MSNLKSTVYFGSFKKHIHWLSISLIFSCACVILASPSLAQAPNPQGDPNQDRFPQPGTTPEPLSPESQPPIQPIPTPTPENPPPESSQTIKVEKINVTGSTVFRPERFQSITQSVEGREVTVEELRKAADAITQLYLDQGYITSRAILVDQTVNNGVVEIRVIEGTIEKIEVQGTRRLNPEYVRSRVALGAGKPLLTAALEDQLRLLRADPLFSNVEASLRAGSGVGQSILIVRVTEAQPFNAALTVDNYSPPSIGSERLGVNASYRNLSGLGDEFSAAYYLTTRGGANIFDFNYRLPLNPMDGTLQLRTSFNDTNVVQEPFAAFDIRGESQLYEISFRQPLIRTPREEFALSLGFAVQNGQTFTFAGPTPFGIGPDEEGNSRTRVIKFGQDYVVRDLNGAWALRSLFSFGLGIFDATSNPNPIPDGQFFSWLAQAQRVQRLGTDSVLVTQAELQLTPNALLPAQQFVVGGGQSVRGYRQNVRAGDNGVRLTVENRLTVQRDASGNSTLQVAPFFDMAYVWNVEDNPNILQRQKFIAGIGLGVLFQPIPQLDIKLDYGYPLIDLDDRGSNAQDDGFYFSVGYRL